MSLFDEHKAERRGRILVAARKLIAERGYEGLTMRDLAKASRVSVPTLYNLFGGKQALLLGELEETFTNVAASLERAHDGSFVERALAACEAGNEDLLAAPDYSRELVHLFLTSEETRGLRQGVQQRYVEMMAGVLREAQSNGELAAWVEPVTVSRRMFAHYLHTMIQWAQGELDAGEFRNATLFGMCLMLLGIARGRAASDIERRAQELQPKASKGPRREARRRTR
jgi:AcrR family transcriptional regulator